MHFFAKTGGDGSSAGMGGDVNQIHDDGQGAISVPVQLSRPKPN